MRLLESAPLLPIAASVAMGIIAASWLRTPTLALVLVSGVLLLLTAVALGCGYHGSAMLLLFTSLVGLGALHGSVPPLPAAHISRQVIPPAVSIEGRLNGEPVRWDAGRMRILLDVDAYHDGSDRRPAEGRVQLTIYGETVPLGEGQRIRAEVRLHRPIGFRNPGVFDYPAHLRREGILLVGSGRGDRVTLLTSDEPAWPVRVKRWAVAAIQAHLPESSAALLAGLLLGERTALPGETDEAFRRAGVYHVLAVSGFNVALVASSVFASLALLGIPRRATALVAGVVLVGFGLVVGGQPSVVRATVMGLLLLLSVLLERDSQVLNALCLSGLLLVVWRPIDLWDPGFQLSFAATAGIIYLVTPLTLFLKERRWPEWLATAVAVSVAAQLAVTPIMLAHFNQLSLIGVAANLFVVPLAGPATTLGMLALLIHLVSETAASLLFNTLWLLLVALRLIVWAAAAIPGAMVHLPAPSAAAIVAWCGALALVPYLATRRWTRLAALALVAAATALSAWPWVSPGDGRLRVTFLDVGQGDATFVELPEGPRILVDGGPGGARRFDVGDRVLSPFLWNRAVHRLDVVALSHSDSDHAGGLGAVLRNFRVREFWENGRWGPGSQDPLLAVARSGTVRRVLRDGQRLWVGRALITVLNPDDQANANLNDDSLVLRLDWRGVSLLLTGDLGWMGEARVLERGAPVRVVVLKVAHHGSRSSSTAAFLESARPAFAVISVGARNPFRHPTPEALARIEAAGARVYRTDRDGAIILETDGARLWVTCWARGTTEVFDLDPETRSDSSADVSSPATELMGLRWYGL
jgi:competence protein ComEC